MIYEFRGIRSYNNEWVYGNLVVDERGIKHIVEFSEIEQDGHHIKIESDTPMFFNQESIGMWTGKFDDEGIKIWQGDIIEIKCVTDDEKVMEHIITEIVFDDDCSSFGFQTNKYGEMCYMDSLPRKDKVKYYDTCKVVGNIHEGVKNEKIS